MKTTRLLFTLLFVAVAVTGFGQISGTAHDFTTAGNTWNTTGQICIVCHTPHNAIDVEAPLWNHSLSVVASYDVYDGPTLDATVGQPGAESRVCLCCHDGTVALANFGGTTNGTAMVPGYANVGTDLTDDHPISFTYDATLATNDGELFDPTTQSSGLGGTIQTDMLFSNQMQCSSCHDVHDDTYGNFLIMDNDASSLCLTCHNK